jgi:predicted type IV restriction endonuclease
MDFMENIQSLASKIAKLRDQIETEEATKIAFVMPFITTLGYDVFNPSEVMPEFTADVGTKKGEKVDYVILHNGTPLMIFECKKLGSPLDANHASQLYRYFSVSKARFGVLTDGAIYKFFTDLEESNKMDLKPFLDVDISNSQHPLLGELKRFAKSSFNLEETIEASKELKYLGGIKSVLTTQLVQPADEFVRFLAAQVYPGQIRHNVLESFHDIVKRAFNQFINDRIADRLRTALNQGGTNETKTGAEVGAATPKSRDNEALSEEIEAYYIVRSVLRQKTDPKRIAMRNSKSYCSILLDDNNRKPLCRLYLHSTQKYVGLFNEHKEETRHAVSDLDDLYKFSEHLAAAINLYDTGQVKDGKETDAQDGEPQ